MASLVVEEAVPTHSYRPGPWYAAEQRQPFPVILSSSQLVASEAP